MRGFSKQPPPANVSPPGRPVRSLTQAAMEFASGLLGTDARRAFDALHKPALRMQLLSEQHHLCVFCEQELGESGGTPRIDHWRPVQLSPTEVFNWKNLHLSCATPNTCDTCKDCKPLKCLPADTELPWPTEYAYEEVLGFTSGGRVYVRCDVDIDEGVRRALNLAIDGLREEGLCRRAILNLNAPALTTAREAAIDDEEGALSSAHGGQEVDRELREERVAILHGALRKPAFVSIRVAWLRKELGKGRTC